MPNRRRPGRLRGGGADDRARRGNDRRIIPRDAGSHSCSDDELPVDAPARRLRGPRARAPNRALCAGSARTGCAARSKDSIGRARSPMRFWQRRSKSRSTSRNGRSCRSRSVRSSRSRRVEEVEDVEEVEAAEEVVKEEEHDVEEQK